MKRILLICAFLLALAVQAGAQSKQQQQQPVEVNGLVVDSDDVPIVGATVYIKDEPGIGSITNSEGRFKLTAKLYNTLAVSFMGYETAEQIITSAADVKITLREGNQMEEVVVIGMGTQRKVSVTGAVAVVDTKDLELPATNIVNTLGGRVPGVISIQSSGEPGRNISEFWVRGIGTFGANSGALVLIDGLEGNLSQIDPADVESFSVLKDAAATAVYGRRGGGGGPPPPSCRNRTAHRRRPDRSLPRRACRRCGHRPSAPACPASWAGPAHGAPRRSWCRGSRPWTRRR